MCVEPVWTEAELLELIGETKRALRDAMVKSVQFDGGGHEMASLPELRAQLEYYKRELRGLRGQAGPVSVIGRVAR